MVPRTSLPVLATAAMVVGAGLAGGCGGEEPFVGCSGVPAVTTYAGQVSTLKFPPSYAPRKGAHTGPAAVEQRVYGLPCEIPLEVMKHIQQYDVDEHRYHELGVIKVDVLRRDGKGGRRLDLRAFERVVLPSFQERGESFTVTDPGLAWPAFQVDVTAPYLLTVVIVETPQLIHYVVAGRSDDALRTVLESIKE